MSESLNTNIKLKQIKAPSLTSNEYGKDIREQFENIDENFRRVSNHDYVEGKSGANINVVDLLLMSQVNGVYQEFTMEGKSMINTITGLDNIDWINDWDTINHDFTESFYSRNPKLSPVSYSDADSVTVVVHFYDYIKSNPNITVFYTLKDVEDEDIESNRNYICSSQIYTFLDQRFANKDEQGGIYSTTFDNGQEDTSCLLTLKYAENIPEFFKSNLFPTLYYDPNDKQFKWKIYGNETGIRAQGAKGEPGSSTSLWIVRTADVNDPNYILPVLPNPNAVPIEKIVVLTDNGWEWSDIINIPQDQRPKAGDACFVLTTTGDPNDPANAYISPAFIMSGIICVITNIQNSINSNLNLNDLLTQLRLIHDGVELGGLFIPYHDNSGVHFLYNPASTKTLRIQPVVPQPGTSLDVSHPGQNVIDDDNTKLDIHYSEINLVARSSSNSIKIDGTGSGTIGIRANNDIDITTNNNDINISSIKHNINVEAKNNIDIKAEKDINITSVTESIKLNANKEVNCTSPVTATVSGVSDVYLGCPIGTIVMWYGDVIGNASINPRIRKVEDCWLLCNGASIVGAEYSKLREKIGNTLPNLVNRFPYGAPKDNITYRVGITGGESSVTLTTEQMPVHNHIYQEYWTVSHNTTGTVKAVSAENNQTDDTGHTNSAGGLNGVTQAHNNMPPYLTVNFIIKYK